MILANVRDMLDRNDAQLALRLIAQGSHEEYELAERELRDHGIEVLLDHPDLFRALLRKDLGARASLPLFACVVVRGSLRRMGENDPALADYVATIFVQFGLRDRSRRITENDDQTYATVVDIAVDLDDADVTRSFLTRAHMGNYALWLSGLFPDFIEQRRRRCGGPDIDYYEEMGKKGFALAASHRLAAKHNLSGVLQRAAERFLVLRIALNNISDALIFPSVNSPDRLMRQVRNDFRWKLAG